jgi:outer membrane cobalamin receptor
LSHSASPVYVVEQEEIRRSGAVTTAQVLRRLPFAR